MAPELIDEMLPSAREKSERRKINGWNEEAASIVKWSNASIDTVNSEKIAVV